MNKKEKEMLTHYMWLTLLGLYETEEIFDFMPLILDIEYKESLKDSES